MTEISKNSLLAEPRGPKPRKIMSRRNIILYGTLLVVAIYYLIPLYVMIVTSLKGMPEIRLGIFFHHLSKSPLSHGLKHGHRPVLALIVMDYREVFGILSNHTAISYCFNSHCIGEWLCACKLAL